MWLLSMANCDGVIKSETPVESTECLDGSIDVQAKMSSDTFYTDAVTYWEVSATLPQWVHFNKILYIFICNSRGLT